MTAQYMVRRTESAPPLNAHESDPAWGQAERLELANFHPESRRHRPDTRVRLLYDDRALYVRFDVDDQWVRSVQTVRQQTVCTDSCVEFFFAPLPDRGYFNIEVNCGGTILAGFGPGRRGRVFLSDAQLDAIEIHHSMPSVVESEIQTPVSWMVAYALPWTVLEETLGAPAPRDRPWLANFYKCADHTSHKHWGMWGPVPERLDFHQTELFQPVGFEQP